MKKLKKGIKDFKRGFKEEANRPDTNDSDHPVLKATGFTIGFIGPIVVIGILVVILFSIFNAIDKADPIDKAKGFFDDRSDKKEMCAERAEDASNSYAAKKIYKACMSN